MEFVEVASFDVAHRALNWPWVAIDPTHTRFAYATDDRHIAARAFDGRAVSEPITFTLPTDLVLPTGRDYTLPPSLEHRGARGIHGFAISPNGDRLAVVGTIGAKSFVFTLDTNGGLRRTPIDDLAGISFVAHAVTFDRNGARLWISAENGNETALILIDAESHALAGVLRSARFPPPSYHELHVHPHDDAVMLLAACGQDGTFARVARYSDGAPVAIKTARDHRGKSSGFVGFSADGARVHLVSDELETLSWPTLSMLSSTPFEHDFEPKYSGAAIDSLIFIDGEIDPGGPDVVENEAVMMFDGPCQEGTLLATAPSGMWVGRIGPNAIITVGSKLEPAPGRLLVVRKATG